VSKLIIPKALFDEVKIFLFQSNLEQGVFLFAQTEGERIQAKEAYLVPPEGWSVQLDVYLEMKDSERGKIMQIARQKGYAVIDCHSHPDSGSDVWFSPSDISGITKFATYVKWKLPGTPYIATVWGEDSIDAIVWQPESQKPELLEAVVIQSEGTSSSMKPRGTWFREPRSYWRKESSSAPVE
jgi:hypothetical protein